MLKFYYVTFYNTKRAVLQYLPTLPAETHGDQPFEQVFAAVGQRCPTELRFHTPEKTQSLMSTVPSSLRPAGETTWMPLVACSIARPSMETEPMPLVRTAHCASSCAVLVPRRRDVKIIFHAALYILYG